MEWALLIPLFAIGMPLGMVIAIFYFDTKNKDKFHSTLQKLIESGQELSPDLLQSIPGYKVDKNGDKNDIRSGTITAAVGIGIALFGHIGIEEEALVGIGLLVFSIGLGILVYGIYNRNKKVDDSS